MQKIAIIACLITLAPLWAENEVDGQSFISYEEWREITASSQEKEDCMVLVDGKRISGTLVRLPSLTYHFVKMEFDPAEIRTVAVVKSQNHVKVQYITSEGQNYIGHLADGKFAFWVNDPSLKDPSNMVEREIDPKFINFIVLANRESKTLHTNPKLGSLELIHGEHLPIAIMSNPILLTDGWSERRVKAEDILELAFDGGVHGKILENGSETTLGFMYAKDQYILVQIPRNQHLVKLPWSQVAYIQGYNGGFRQLKPERDLFNPTYFQKDVVLDQIGSMEIRHQTINSDYIGMKKGELLDEAFCSYALSPQAIAEVERIGWESLIAMEQLFDSTEEEEWLAEIELEDFEDISLLLSKMEEATLDDLILLLASQETMEGGKDLEPIEEPEFDMDEEIVELKDFEWLDTLFEENEMISLEEKHAEEVSAMILNNELEVYDDLIEIKLPEWTQNIAFEGERGMPSEEVEKYPEELNAMLLDNELEVYDDLTEIKLPEWNQNIAFEGEKGMPSEEVEKPSEKLNAMLLDNELEVYDDQTEIKLPEWSLTIAFDENQKETLQEKEGSGGGGLIGIDAIVIDQQDLEKEISEDVIWKQSEYGSDHLNLTPSENLFIEELLN